MLKQVEKHLKESSMSYMYHWQHGIVNGTRLIAAGLASYVHSFLPHILKKYSLVTVIKLYNEVSKRKHVKRLIEDINSEH